MERLARDIALLAFGRAAVALGHWESDGMLHRLGEELESLPEAAERLLRDATLDATEMAKRVAWLAHGRIGTAVSPYVTARPQKGGPALLLLGWQMEHLAHDVMRELWLQGEPIELEEENRDDWL